MDWPIAGDIKGLHGDALRQHRERWWKRHDKHTNGIPGLFPLIYDLPVCFTHKVDQARKIYKFTRGKLKGWDLQDIDAATVRASDEPEIVLERLPRRLIVEIAGTGMLQHLDLDPQHFAVNPRKVTWSVDAAGTCQLQRTGFPLVVDFGATIHSVTGQEFDFEILDLNSFWTNANLESMLMAYIGLSRVKKADGLLLVEPFSPCLFQQGTHPGPCILMEFLRGHIAEEDLPKRLEAAEEEALKKRHKLHTRLWRCGFCEHEKKVVEFTSCQPHDRHYQDRI